MIGRHQQTRAKATKRPHVVERLDPDSTADVLNRRLHLERYRWATARVVGDSVLDLACGVGYGSAMLAEAASRPHVLGADRSQEAIDEAKARYGSERVSFERIDDAAAYAPERRFDTVVSLETLEHLERPIAFLRRMHALLAPGGRLILSAPVRESPGQNPFHLHCFTDKTLRALVCEGFVIEDQLDQCGGAYLTVAARRREKPSPAWRAGEGRARATIALVTWNSLDDVVDLIGAIRGFTRQPYELLVVDNDSTDGVQSFLRLFASEPGVRVIQNAENLQCAAATNQAIALCETEYRIYLCASHALVIEPDWVEAMIAYLDEHPEIDIAGDVWNPGFVVPGTRYREGWTPGAHGRDRLLHVQGGAWIARRALFEEVGPFDQEAFPHRGMDVEFSYRLLSHGKKLGRHPGVLSPPFPKVPVRGPGVLVVHPASPQLRGAVRGTLGWERPAAVGAASAPLAALAGWRATRGEVTGLDDGFHVRAVGPDTGLISPDSYRNVRIRGRVAHQGVINLKARIASGTAADADGYHVLIGPGTDYVARANHVLGRFPPLPSAFAFVLELVGGEIRLDVDGRRLFTVRDGLLASGSVFLGVNSGEARFSDVQVERLDGRGDVDKPPILVYCERLPNESFCASVVRELERYYTVRAFGPGWPTDSLDQVDHTDSRFYLELDAASGSFCHPEGLATLDLPKFAWLVDTHKKPTFHQAIAREMDLTFYAMKSWGHVFGAPAVWLPLHCDGEIFKPVDALRTHDVVFVGSQTWRADAIVRTGKRPHCRWSPGRFVGRVVAHPWGWFF